MNQQGKKGESNSGTARSSTISQTSTTGGFAKKWVFYRAVALAVWFLLVAGGSYIDPYIENEFSFGIERASLWLAFSLALLFAVVVGLGFGTRDGLFYLPYVVLFPLALLLNVMFFFVRNTRRVRGGFVFLISGYFAIFVILMAAILCVLEVQCQNAALTKVFVIIHSALVFAFMLFALRWSANPLRWCKSILAAGAWLIEFNWKEEELTKASADIGKATARLGEVEQWFKSLKWAEDRFASALKRARRAVTVSFLAMLFFAAIWTLVQFAFMYYAIDKADSSAWTRVSAPGISAMWTWLVMSFGILSTSAFVPFQPNTGLAYYLVCAQTATGLMMVTVFLLEFTVNAESAVQQVMRQVNAFLETERSRLMRWKEKLSAAASPASEHKD